MNLAKYFKANRHSPKFKIGDRVTGRWHGIPFAGTVANESVRSESEGPLLQVFSDLPIKYKDEIHTFIQLNPAQAKLLK